MRFMPGPHDPAVAGILPIRAPTLLLWGEDDKINPADMHRSGRARSRTHRLGNFPELAIYSFTSAPTPSRRSAEFARLVPERDVIPAPVGKPVPARRPGGRLASVEDAVSAIARGRMVVVVDAEDRENEGDLVMAAEHVTPEAINFMATQRPRSDLRADAVGARRRPCASRRWSADNDDAARHRVPRLRRCAGHGSRPASRPPTAR